MSAYKTPSVEEIAALEARAHEMRAEALREGFAAFVAVVASLPGRVFGYKTTA